MNNIEQHKLHIKGESALTVEVLLSGIVVVQLGAIVALVSKMVGVDISMPNFSKNDGGTQEQEMTDQQADEYYDVLSERNREFDARMQNMKDELANTQPYTAKQGFAAETEPGVENLPHSIISDTHSDSMDGEEYAR